MNCVAIVPAAGQGERLGLGPKAFLSLGDRTLLELVVQTLRPCVDRIIVAVPADRLDEARSLVGDRAGIIAGAATRQATVERLFDAATEPLVLIHDVTRPFASTGLVRRVLDAAGRHGAAAAMVHPPIPVGMVCDGRITASHDRLDVMLPQSPQAFHRTMLAAALAHAAATGLQRQTTWQLLAAMGKEIVTVAGEDANIKITTALDWDIARRVIWPALHTGNDPA